MQVKNIFIYILVCISSNETSECEYFHPPKKKVDLNAKSLQNLSLRELSIKVKCQNNVIISVPYKLLENFPYVKDYIDPKEILEQNITPSLTLECSEKSLELFLKMQASNHPLDFVIEIFSYDKKYEIIDLYIFLINLESKQYGEYENIEKVLCYYQIYKLKCIVSLRQSNPSKCLILYRTMWFLSNIVCRPIFCDDFIPTLALKLNEVYKGQFAACKEFIFSILHLHVVNFKFKNFLLFFDHRCLHYCSPSDKSIAELIIVIKKDECMEESQEKQEVHRIMKLICEFRKYYLNSYIDFIFLIEGKQLSSLLESSVNSFIESENLNSDINGVCYTSQNELKKIKYRKPLRIICLGDGEEDIGNMKIEFGA